MSKSFIILSCFLAISQLGNVSHALDNVPASTRNYELSNSHEEPMVNSDEDDSNRKTGTKWFLILLKNSKENETSMEEETEDDNEQINGGQKTKRCMALNLLRKTRLISMPKDARKKLSRFAEKSINDGVQNPTDGKSYFRFASRKDTDNILKSLLKSRSSKSEDNDSIVSKSQDRDPIILVSQDSKKSGNQKPKKYVCYCIDDNCVTKKPKQHSRPNAMRTTIEQNVLAKNSYSTNEKNRRISDLVSHQQQDLGAAHNLHCPPGAVLVEESDHSECSDRKHHSHKRRPVKKCLPITMPCESEAESIGQPMRINFPFAGKKKFNSRVYKVDRTLPFVQKLQTLIEHHDAPVQVPCVEKVPPLNNVLGVEDYYSNNQKDVDRYAQVPMAQNLVHPSPYVPHTQHSQYPQYSDSLVDDSQIPSKPVDQPYKGHQEPSYEETVRRRPFLDTEECFKKFGPSICTVLETPIPIGTSPKIIENHDEEHEESTIGSQWEKEMHTTTELPARKINKWSYPTNAHDNDKITKTYLHQKKAGGAANEEDKKKVSHSGRYSQSRIPTKPEEYHDIPRQYFSDQPINIKNQPSYNLPRITNSNDKIVSSTYFDDRGNFLEPNSLIRHSDPNNMEYLRPTANPGESETEDYYDVTEEAREDEVRKTPSVGRVSKFPQLASTSISSPQYREYTTKPTGKDVDPSLREDTSEVIARYVSTPHGSSSRYGTSEDQYSENTFLQEHDQDVDEVTKYYTTRPSERVGIAKQHTIHGSPSYDEKRLESSTKSPNTVFMKMEEPWSNYETTISTEDLKGNRFQGSQRITTVYPVIDNEKHTLSASSRTQSSNNRIDENAVPSANLYYSIQPEQTVAYVAPTFATKMASPQSPVGTIELAPINNYSKSGFVSSSTSRSDNQYPTSHVAMKNVVYDTTPLLGISKLGQRKFTVTSRPAQNNVEVKTISSWPNEIEETNIEDNQGEKLSTTHYPARSEIADIDKYSSTQKSSHVQYIGSPQLTNYERTTDKFEHTLDNDLSKKVTNHHSPVPSRNWDYSSQSGKKMTSFIDQETSTTDRGAHKQSVESHRSFADGIFTTSRSDLLNKPTSYLGTIHSPTAADGFQKSTQQPSKMSSEYDLYSSQSERPLFIMNHRKSTQPEDSELGHPTADNSYSAEDVPKTYTTAESIFGESTTAETETHKLEKNRNGKSRNPSKESHQLITTPSEYDNSKEVQRPLETTLSFENNSDMKEEFNGFVAFNSFDDKVEEVTTSDSYYEEKDPKNYNDFNSTSSDDSTVTDNNETKDINSSTVADEEVGVANLPKTTNALSINNSKHYMRYHNGVVEESTPKETTLNDEVIIETQSYKEDDNDFSPIIQTINGDMPHLYPAKNYEEKHLPTNYYETVSPQSKDDMTRISKDEFENPSDTPYSSTPMSVTHYVRNPSTISDIFKSENVVHDKSLTEGRSNDYSTNQYSQNTPETRSFAISEDLTLPTLKQVPSSTSKNKESVGKPLGSDSTTSIDETELLGLFSRAKSAGSSTFDEDQSYLTCAVQKVVQNLISPESNNPYKNAPNTPDTVLSSNQGLSSELPVLKNLFSLPEVKDMVINTVKDLISEASAEDILLSRLKDQEIESVMNEVVNNLLPGKSATLTTSMTTDKQQYKNGHWIVVPASLTPIEGNVVQKPDDEMFNSIKNIIERSEIRLQSARLPVVQNIIVHAVENLLKKAKKVMNHSLIRETLNNIIARAENAENSTPQSLSTLGPMPKIPDKKTPSGSLKNMPNVPVIERVFKNGQWSDKETVLGIRNNPFDYKFSPSTTTMSNDDSELRTSSSDHETSMINANNLKVTTDAVDYVFLGESEEKEDQRSTPDVGEVNGNVSIEKILESVDATATEQNIEHEADPENAPIKYYSPNDRILTYIKNHQTLEGKTDTTLHSSDVQTSPDMQINEYSTTGSVLEVEHATVFDSDEVPVALEETAESEESGERITSGDQSTTPTHRHKFTKIPKYYDSSQEATTLTRGLLGAAKSRDKIQHLRENMKGPPNFVTPDSDPTYFGKLTLNGGNPSENRISDLTNTDLFYIGDGVKIPLTIRRMPDGSYALSISEKICERFTNRKCPCCVPNEGDIVEESRKPNVDDGVESEITSKKNSHDSGSFEPTESSEYEGESKRRYVRSTSGSDIITTKISPVESFVKKYNMTLNLVKDHNPRQSLTIDEKEIQEIGNTRRNKRLGSLRDTKIMNLFDNNNQLQRDDSEEQMQITDDNSEVISKESNFIRRSEFSYDKDVNSFVHDLLHIRDVPENKRTEIVVNALDGLINSASVKNLIPSGHQSMTEFIAVDSTEDQSQWEDSSVYDLQDVENKIARYGYQKDNPILERIRFIKENQHGHGQYKYQQNIDRHARGKMNILKTVLHWLREVFLEAKGNDKN